MKLWVCLLMLASKAAAVQDMTGKVFTFPRETELDFVKLNAGSSNFVAATVCHRSFTDLTRDHAFFSLATPSKMNAILTYFDSGNNRRVVPHFNDVQVGYNGLDYAPNKWHSICSTFDARTGLVQLWFNGQPLVKKYSGPVPGDALSGQPFIVLGQDQDTYGGGFDVKQSFVGRMTDVHMWDQELSACEIQKYSESLSFSPGNVVNWAELDFETHGKVLIENNAERCDSSWFQ